MEEDFFGNYCRRSTDQPQIQFTYYNIHRSTGYPVALGAKKLKLGFVASNKTDVLSGDQLKTCVELNQKRIETYLGNFCSHGFSLVFLIN
jgi:hypothetical protein